MPTDPNLVPPGVEGPFSRYLNAPLEGKAQEDAAPEPRPSGFMGTGGKLAMFGAQLLKGLQRGKMQKYAQQEQEVFQKYAEAARRVEAFQSRPDIPDETKAEAGNLLAGSFATIGKQQAAELKKLHGKEDGPHNKILGVLGSVFDKLGGPTPAGHTLGGTKETGDNFNKLNQLLAGYHEGGEKYSKQSIIQKNIQQVMDVAKKYRNNPRGLQADSEFYTAIANVAKQGPEGKRIADQLLNGAISATSVPEIKEQQALTISQMGTAAPAPTGAPPMADRGSPAPEATGNPRLIPQPGEEAGPMFAKPSSDTLTPAREAPAASGMQFPFTFPDGKVAQNATQYHTYLTAMGGRPEKQYRWNITKGVDGKPKYDKIEIHSYRTLGLTTDSLGNPIDPKTVKDMPIASAGEHPPTEKAPPKEPLGREEVIPGPNGPIKILVDPRTNKRIKDSEALPVYEKARVGRAADPLAQETREVNLLQKKQLLAAEEGKNLDTKKKKDVKSIVDKIIRQSTEFANANNTTLDKVLASRINDFSVWYKDDPRIQDNFDDIQETLRKRYAEAVSLNSKESLAAQRLKKAQDDGALPQPQKSSPKPETPKPQQATPAAPEPTQEGFSVTDPNGKTHTFKTQALADQFKKLTGIK